MNLKSEAVFQFLFLFPLVWIRMVTLDLYKLKIYILGTEFPSNSEIPGTDSQTKKCSCIILFSFYILLF